MVDMDIHKKNIHFIGCQGASMRGLMRIAESRGATASGSDLALNGHSADNIGENVKLVVYSGAVAEDNIEFIEAKRRGIPCVERGEFLGRLCGSFENVIAVAGTHGKTTTSAMLGCVMREAALHFGGQCSMLSAQGAIEDIDGVRLGGDTLITEACEFRRSMLHIKEAVAVITNIDFDIPIVIEIRRNTLRHLRILRRRIEQ